MPELKVLVGNKPATVQYDVRDDLVDIACLLEDQGHAVNPAFGNIFLEDGSTVSPESKPRQGVLYRFGKSIYK